MTPESQQAAQIHRGDCDNDGPYRKCKRCLEAWNTRTPEPVPPEMIATDERMPTTLSAFAQPLAVMGITATPAPVDHAALAENLPAVSVCHWCKKVPDVLSMGAALVDRDGGFAVQCAHCVEVGPREKTRKDAIEGWNEFQVRELHRDALSVSPLAVVDGETREALKEFEFVFLANEQTYKDTLPLKMVKEEIMYSDLTLGQLKKIRSVLKAALRAHPAGGVSDAKRLSLASFLFNQADNHQDEPKGALFLECANIIRAAGMTQPPSGYVSEYNGASIFTEHRPNSIPDACIFPVWHAPVAGVDEQRLRDVLASHLNRNSIDAVVAMLAAAPER